MIGPDPSLTGGLVGAIVLLALNHREASVQKAAQAGLPYGTRGIIQEPTRAPTACRQAVVKNRLEAYSCIQARAFSISA